MSTDPLDKYIATIAGRHYRLMPLGARACLQLSAATVHLLNGPLRGLIANAGVMKLLEDYDKGQPFKVRDLVQNLNAEEIFYALEVMADYVLESGEGYVDGMLSTVFLLESKDGKGKEDPCGDGQWDDVFREHFLDLFEVLVEVAQRNFLSSGRGSAAIKASLTQALKSGGLSKKQKSSTRKTRSRRKS